MKKIILSSCTALLLTALTMVTNAQSLEKKYLEVCKLKAKGYSVLSEYYYSLKKGETKYIERSFSSEVNYAVIAIPVDEGVVDSDLYIKYPSGTIYKKDNDDFAWSVVYFSTYFDMTFRIHVNNFNSRSSYSRYNFHVIVLGK